MAKLSRRGLFGAVGAALAACGIGSILSRPALANRAPFRVGDVVLIKDTDLAGRIGLIVGMQRQLLTPEDEPYRRYMVALPSGSRIETIAAGMEHARVYPDEARWLRQQHEDARLRMEIGGPLFSVDGD